MSEHEHHHDHDHAHPITRSGFRFLFFCLIELAAGIVALNSALVTSALHDFFDGVSMIFSGRLDSRWAKRRDHKSYCTKRGQLGIANALLGPLVSALGLLVESRSTITRVDMLIAVVVGGVGFGLNFLGLFETFVRRNRLDLGYLAHFSEDIIGSAAVITTSILAYNYQDPRYIWIGSLLIIGVTLGIGLIAACYTAWTISHTAENHPHERESAQDHQYHADTPAAS